MKEHGDSLQLLVGQPLTEIWFVMGYIQIPFEAATLSLLENPIVEIKGTQFTFPEPGYRDALCALIGRTVKSATLTPGKAIDFSFDPAARLVVPLDHPDRKWEAASLSGRDGLYDEWS